ncbi:hypothetical protein D3C80_1497100 [compost metagenome]
MYKPVLFDFVRVFIRHRKLNVLNNVCQLKYNTDNHSGNTSRDQVTDQRMLPAHHYDRYNDEHNKIENLSRPETNMVFSRHLRHLFIHDLTCKVFGKIIKADPCDIG